MRKKWLVVLLILFVATFATVVFANVDYTAMSMIDEKSFLALDDVDIINQNRTYGKFLKVFLEKDELAVGEDKYRSGKVVFKLFGFIPIKEVDVEIISNEEVYLGGNALGFKIMTEGVIVVGTNSVMTEAGRVDTLENVNLKVGDVIKEVNGQKVEDVFDISKIINTEENLGKPVKVKAVRKGKVVDTEITPAIDENTNKSKLGIWIRDDASGIGTLTFVDKTDLRFGALGHPITDFETGAKLDVQNGKVFACSIVGIEKGKRGSPGQIKGVFLESKTHKGEIDSNSEFGLFGEIQEKTGVVDENKTAFVGGRLTVKPGKAKLVSCVSGVREEYDIEIIKASKQKTAKDKSLVIRVVDKRLLELTGGIVQGMSGSPIMQNGKVIGAVTHVFVSDPTKGYGIYIDWMRV